MKADYPLLGVLARQPMSGYGLAKWLETDGQFLGRKPSMTPIYRALADLADRGWVQATTVASETAPDAKVYALTAAGRIALQDWARSPYTPSPRPMDPDFIVRLNFAGQLGPDVALALVRTELDYRLLQRAEEAGPYRLGMVSPIPEIDVRWLERVTFFTHSRGWQSTSWYIGWLETLAAELSSIIASGQYSLLDAARVEGSAS
ncbi:PadR family transcriptional regulator [Microbacterium sp. ARD32]|uniref:PadR family transcriptional regulator n=1 Tax=Microbacterium sp. ARD32 TaxID=2962577 RepID=UPI0028821C45|nr:PadR family transcriptional regulator [Microbacterium sp. ARD32]MDT0158213.1 PadR family transcriptional regulator [Microbacterium sp. ARD32]